MSDEPLRLEVSVTASWTAEIPADVDPENDLYSEEDMAARFAEQIGLPQREEVVEWDVNIQTEVTTDE